MIYQSSGKSITILLVEDNEGDARLAREAFKEAKVKNVMYHVTDGEEALKFLFKRDKYAAMPHPDLILLDLNLPKKDGREVLEEIKNDENLKSIPVVVMTASSAEEDILKTYKLHANCYIQKPLDFDKFIKVVKSVEDFWLSIVILPSDLRN